MKSNKYTDLPIWEKLKKKVLIYYQTVWAEKRLNASHYKEWLSNFKDDELPYNEKLNAMYLLSKFMFFGHSEIRELLLAVYRDKFKYKVVEGIRRNNANTVNLDLINNSFLSELHITRFVGLGDASESGNYLLYLFRQVNKLPTYHFKTESEIFNQDSGRVVEPDVKRYIFIDDFCGSGETATGCNSIISEIKARNPFAEFYYFVLFATEKGIDRVKAHSEFDCVETVYKLDHSFKCFTDNCRYYTESYDGIDKAFTKTFAQTYGDTLVAGTPVEGHPLGFDDGQLLVGFSHNTPDNSLPIIWAENEWKPSFVRFIKQK